MAAGRSTVLTASSLKSLTRHWLVEQTDNAKQWLDAHAQIYRLSESVFAGFASALECRSYAAAAAQASS